MSDELINKRIDDTLRGWKSPFEVKEKSWDSISAQLQKEEVVGIWPKVFAVAASVVLLLGLFTMLQDSDVSYNTLASQHQSITLPDGSVVVMNAGSSITFEDEWSDSRLVNLEGEAFFKVQKGSKFSVVTSNGTVEVLGTSFNVYSRDNELKVVCKTGKVKVSADDSSVLLTPGLATDTEPDGLKNPYARENANGWIIGELDYEDEPVENVFAELERQFGIGIEYTKSSDVVFSGPVSLENLNTALSIVCPANDLAYEIRDESRVIITQN